MSAAGPAPAAPRQRQPRPSRIPTDPAERSAYYRDLQQRSVAAQLARRAAGEAAVDAAAAPVEDGGAQAATPAQLRARTERQAQRARDRSASSERHGRYDIARMTPEEQAAWSRVAPAPGRLTIDAARVSAVVDALLRGAPLVAAAAAGGIADATLHGWLSRGQADEAEGRDTAHARLARATKAAELQSILGYLATLDAAGGGIWQKTAWLLERRWPQHFGRRDAVAVGVQGEVRVTVRYVDEREEPPEVIDMGPPRPERSRRDLLAAGHELDGQPGNPGTLR